MQYNNFQLIPVFIEGYYTTQVGLDGLEHILERYERNYSLELNPDFQRVHVWNEDQRISFVEHVLRGGKNTVIRWNCAGFMKSNNAGPMILVDGKQRLNAIRLFMANELPAFNTFLMDFDGHLPGICNFTFIVNDLVKKEDILKWYLEINMGNVAHTSEELERVKQLLMEEQKEGV